MVSLLLKRYEGCIDQIDAELGLQDRSLFFACKSNHCISIKGIKGIKGGFKDFYPFRRY